jgi:dinuclear metal center YbgI/SA1388 family protein
MVTIDTVSGWLDQMAPAWLAEDWDNVGLLVGRGEGPARRVMTCLTVTPQTAAEAVREQADLIVTHHPMPFRPLKRLTSQSTVGRLLLELIAARVAVYSAHTAFDSTVEGVNARLAEGVGLRDVAPLIPAEAPDANDAGGRIGTGRVGTLATPGTLDELGRRLRAFLGIDRLQRVGLADWPVSRVAIACGAAGSLLQAAVDTECQAMILGETSFHTCLEAEARGVGLLLPGHYASERFALECLAEALAGQFPALTIWASRDERDPLAWL